MEVILMLAAHLFLSLDAAATRCSRAGRRQKIPTLIKVNRFYRSAAPTRDGAVARCGTGWVRPFDFFRRIFSCAQSMEWGKTGLFNTKISQPTTTKPNMKSVYPQ